VQTGRFGRLL